MTSINDVIAKLNPKTAEAFVLGSQTHNDLLETPSLGLNLAIGGLGYGRQSLLWGNRSGGKTAFCLQTAALAQKNGKSVAWIDAEKNYDKVWARRMGVNPDEIIVSKITSIAEMADAGHDLIKSGIDVLVIDSISALLPQSFFEDKTEEMKGLKDTGQIGTFSKNMGAACNMLNRVNEHTAIIMISQMRNKIGSYGAALSYMGGTAVEHMNSTAIKLWSNPSEKESIKGTVTDGDLIITKPVGRPVTWTVDKNRGPGMNMSNSYDLYFAGDHVGVDLAGEVVDFGVEYGKIRKGGAWYYIGDEKFQGRPAAVQYLRDNDDIREKVYGEILAQSL